MKRIICVMLTLIMLVSLVPTGAITANAATLATSKSAITVLKNKDMLIFSKTCYRVGETNEYRIGYGSICNKSHAGGAQHTTTQATADTELGADLKKIDTKLNSFASSNGLTLSQGQFDALSLLSYLTGTAWMSGNGTVKTAVKNGAGSTEMLNAFYAVLNQSDAGKALNRSKILVNMYFNGKYSNSTSEDYSKVTYDANGGKMAVVDESYKVAKAFGDTYTLYYDASKSAAHPVTPTKNGAKFMGWYFVDGTTPIGRSAALDDKCTDATLVAQWQENSVVPTNAASKALKVNYTVKASQLASNKFYKSPDKKAETWPGVVTDYVGTDAFRVYNEYLAADGSRWVRYKDAQDWLLLANAPGSSSGSGSGSSGVGTRIGVNVTNGYVNIRKDANIYSAKVGTLKQNDRVYISRTEQNQGFLWGHAYSSRTTEDDLGWIALMYTDYNTAKYEDQGGSSTPPKPANTVIAKATITYNGYVNMRDIPGTDSKIVGSLAKNEIVSVFEIKTVNGHQWGRTNGGWFCLTYANVQMLSGSSDISNSGSTAYTFTGKALKDLEVYVDTTIQSNLVVEEKYLPNSGDAVSIITLKIANGQTWAKIGWTYTYQDANGKDQKATKYGWVKVGDDETGGFNYGMIALDNVKFTVVADTLNVRANPGSGSTSITKMNKGYEFVVKDIRVYNEEIWGATDLDEINGGESGKESGWVNLASKYAQRSDQIKAPSTPKDEEPKEKDFATIIGADRVNVRADSKIGSKLVGQLARGAVVEILDWENGWYRVDADVDNNDDTESWVYGDYVEETHQSSDIANAPSSHGTGVVANTYLGVNVRTGPSTGHAIVGNKLLPGTQVKILETTYTGVTKWGRIDKGWVCMDYISMTNEIVDVPEPPKPEAPNGGEWIGDYDEVDRTTTTAVYTGYVYSDELKVWANTEHHESDTDNTHLVRTLKKGDPLTVYELIEVVEKTETRDEDGKTKVETIVSYWARINDGYIMTPMGNVDLDSLDEKAHTLTGADTLNVRRSTTEWADPAGEILGKLEKGDVVYVTKLSIINDKVWGRIEFEGEEGWIRLDYMAEGALYEEPEETKPPVTEAPAPPANNNDNSMGDTGKNNGTYRYDGKVINTQELNIRSKPDGGSAIAAKAKSGQTLYIYDTTISNGMAWGRTDGGYVYLYYVDLVPRDTTYVDARVVFNPGTPIYSDSNRTEKVGSYQSMATIDIYEIVGNMARTELGWVCTGDLLN